MENRTERLDESDPASWSVDAQTLAATILQHGERIRVLTDANGTIQMFNAVAQRITGYHESETIGQNILEFFVPAAWRPIVLERFSRTWSVSLRQPHRNPWLSKSGHEIMIEWRCIGVHPPHETLNARPWVYGIGVVVPEPSATVAIGATTA